MYRHEMFDEPKGTGAWKSVLHWCACFIFMVVCVILDSASKIYNEALLKPTRMVEYINSWLSYQWGCEPFSGSGLASGFAIITVVFLMGPGVITSKSTARSYGCAFLAAGLIGLLSDWVTKGCTVTFINLLGSLKISLSHGFILCGLVLLFRVLRLSYSRKKSTVI